MTNKERLIVALDVDTIDEVKALVSELKDEVGMFKVGMQLFNSQGAEIIAAVKESGSKIFLDLKLHDIPNTVAAASRVLTRLGVDIINVHAQGGTKMMKAAKEAIEDEALKLGIKAPMLIAVTILTSLDVEDIKETGYDVKPEEMVKKLGLLTKNAGLDGVVCSPKEAGLIKEVCGSDFKTITPGIRMVDGTIGDQKRVTTPKEAIEGGSTYIVVGRPITGATNKVEAARNIVKNMEEANVN